MITALTCDNWTIFSTLITGAVFGFFILFGAVAALIYSDAKARRLRQDEIQTGRVGKVAVASSDVVYDQAIHGH